MFFKILLYGMISYLFGTLFIACYQAVHGIQPAGFHVGYFGHIGCYFFCSPPTMALWIVWPTAEKKRISQNQTGCSYTPDPSPGVIDPQYGKSRPDSQPSFSVSGHSHDPDSLFCGQAPGLSRCGAGDHPRDAAIQRLCCFLLYHRTAQSICFLS